MNILLVEDNASDVRLLREGFKALEIHCHLSVVADGEEALEYFYQRGRWANAPRPDLVLLDLNLPRKGGMEVLREVKQNPMLRRIPVMVLTSSSSPKDVNMAYELAANTYVRKAGDLDEMYDVVRTIAHYWLGLALLPSA